MKHSAVWLRSFKPLKLAVGRLGLDCGRKVLYDDQLDHVVGECSLIPLGSIVDEAESREPLYCTSGRADYKCLDK